MFRIDQQAEKSIWEQVVVASGLPDQQVIWSKGNVKDSQSGRQPKMPYIVLEITDSSPRFQPSSIWDEEGNFELVQCTEIELRMKIISLSSAHLSILDRVSLSFHGDLARSRFQGSNLAFLSAGGVPNIELPYSTQFVNCGICDCRFGFAETYSEDLGTIEKVTVDGTIQHENGQEDVTVTVPSQEPTEEEQE